MKPFVLLAVLALIFAGLQVPAAKAGQNSSNDQHKVSPKPQPEYVGDEACRTCHSYIYDSFKKTGMGRSTYVPSAEDLRELAQPVTLSSANLNRSYKAYVKDGKIVHEETGFDAAGHIVFSESHDIAYTVGAGDLGKSYLVFKGDSLFVSPISYYNRIRGFDLSPGYDKSVFHGFSRRAGDLCVDCHTGMPRFVPGSHDRFEQPAFRFLTIGCERCHGPGSVHVAQRTKDSFFEGSVDPSIVNPRKLAPDARDEICMQCHFAGDARVLQPGKDYLDFRPGTSLGNVVAIFSVPQSVKKNHFILLDQFEQLKLSRCWNASNGRMGCISCHNPHVQRRGVEAADFYRSRCLTCHTAKGCTAPPAKRQATAPADNCISCHMPQQPAERIDHTSLTDHRILRTQSEVPAAMEAESSASLDLLYDTKAPDPGDMNGLRSLAIAYGQVGARYPEFDRKAIQMLELAAATFPDDPDVQSTFGKALILTHSPREQVAAQALQKAIDAGSDSAEVRTLLARIRMQQGEPEVAVTLYKQAIKLDPYFALAYLDLAHVYAAQKDSRSAVETLDNILKLDPGNDAAREERLKIAGIAEDR